jgi:cystathionine gamma-synthase
VCSAAPGGLRFRAHEGFNPDATLWTSPRWRAEDLGSPLPPSPHANSVCLPTWRDVCDYEEKKPRVLDRLQAGYPRFVVPPRVAQFLEVCRQRFAGAGERCLAYPSEKAARRSVAALQRWAGVAARIQAWGDDRVAVVIYPDSAHEWALKYWRHTGDGLSSRRAEALLQSVPGEPDGRAALAAVRARIASLMDVPPECVWLFPSGMAAIYTAHRAVTALKPGARSVQYGFPYVDTLKIQQDLGPGAVFLPFGNEAELPDLAAALAAEPISGVFCEFPSNPLLGSPPLQAVSDVAARHRVPVIVDDTISTYANVNPLPACDLVVTSLTKFFTGRGDVMAGAIVLNPKRPLAGPLRAALEAEFEDAIWGGDALVMDAYSVDFVERMRKTNATTAALTTWLREQPAVADVFYPLFRDRAHYDAFKRPGAGYSGLFSLVLKHPERTSAAFFDRLRISKGPNLGTTFSLACPFTLLAHYTELDWAERCGVSRHLIRVSVGLEEAADVQARFAEAITALGGI